MSNPFRTPGVREAIEAIGAKLRYCRRIRPDLNLIELVSRKPPSGLRGLVRAGRAG
jgi:hypothetical protein